MHQLRQQIDDALLGCGLTLDVRFLPNPHFVPKYRPLPGNSPVVARYIRSFPQTREFVDKISQLLIYLIPHSEF